ncbi:hypothetical protein AYK26_03615 [Euryarchaeota archaeon SM23-78]|nr:MAG: hypothetical protein AYK26_03615 [Euryarchaeota archaeon SM23-78]MBW3000539.1 hypothetical protein [Candidatus Woesearchaeota archaeon]
MQSNKFLKKAHEIAQRDKIVFDTLMEFERDKRIRTKTRLNFTIDKNIAFKFKKYCREKGYNMSSKVEAAMKEMVAK